MSGPNPNGFSMVAKTWSGPGRMRTRKTSINSKAIAPNRTKRSHAGVCPRPVGKMNPSAMTRPPSITKRLVSQPARPAIVAPAGPSATAEECHAARQPRQRIAGADQHHHPPDRVLGSADDEQRPDRGKSEAEELEAHERQNTEPERVGDERDGINDAERDRADGADQRGHEPADRVRPCQRPHQRSHRPMRDGWRSLTPTVLCRSFESASAGRRRIAHPHGEGACCRAPRRSGSDRSVDRPCAGLGSGRA